MRRTKAQLLHPPSPVLLGRGRCALCMPRANGAARSVTSAPSGCDQAAELVATGHHGSVAPEPLEVVVLALLLVEDVHHDVDEVQQDPVGLALALAPQGSRAIRAAGALDLLGDRANLAIIGAGADDEVVADDQRLGDVQDDHVTSLLVSGRRRSGQGQVKGAGQGVSSFTTGLPPAAADEQRPTWESSEERRVGKECRSRW